MSISSYSTQGTNKRIIHEREKALFLSFFCTLTDPPDTECEWWLMALTPVLLLVCVSLLLQLARLSVELLLLLEPRLLRAVVLVS